MNKRLTILLMLILFVLCSAVLSACTPSYSDSTPLPEYILGRWRGQSWHYLGTDLHNIDYQLEFIAPDTLILNSEPNGVFSTDVSYVNNLILHYQFTSGNQIIVNNQGTFTMKLTRMGSQLAVTSEMVENEVLFLERAPEIHWPLLAFGLGVCVVVVLSWLARTIQVQNPLHGVNLSSARSVFNQSNFGWWIFSLILLLLISLLGVRISVNIWNANLLQWIRLPWDAVITLELGIFIAGLGLIPLFPNRLMIWRIGNTIRNFWYLIGVFLLGFSFFGIFSALFRLGEFMTAGRYNTF